MGFELKDYKNDLLFIPLGGTNEIGINVNLYHYKGKWLMIDCGSGFADNIAGVDMLVADLDFIIRHKKDLVGLVLTHAHEDHVGAVQYFWQELGCPIYATNFTANFLQLKLEEFDYDVKVKINIIEFGSKIDLNPFILEVINLTHSAPEMQAVLIKTSAGNVIHTGDWKFDPNPVLGSLSDEDKLRECGSSGVLALVCDSTNVFSQGHSGSEGALQQSLVELIGGCLKLVVVTTFASNLARLYSLLYAAEKLGRKVVLTGKSLQRILAAAQNSGYLKDIDLLINEREIGRYKREEILVIATGCQGEPLAAVAKMANGTSGIKLAPCDTIIFSSKIIPGNEKKIARLFNSFVKLGIEVMTERDHFVHVSGHPCVEELKHMYDLVKPIISIPVHGEPVHIHEHAKLARKWGVKHAIETANGAVVRLDPTKPTIVGKVHNGYLAVDGSSLLPISSPILKIRNSIGNVGVAIAMVVLGANTKILTKPILYFPGCLDNNDDKDFIVAIEHELMNILKVKLRDKATNIELEKAMHNCIKRMLLAELGKQPHIIIHIERIDQRSVR